MIAVSKLAWITMIITMNNYNISETKESTHSQERNASHNFYSKLLIPLVK